MKGEWTVASLGDAVMVLRQHVKLVLRKTWLSLFLSFFVLIVDRSLCRVSYGKLHFE